MSLLTWHRPEYEGRENELINQNAIADLAGVTRAAVSNWTVRDRTFPQVVAVQGIRPQAPRLYVRAEVETWLTDRESRPRAEPQSRAPSRSRREILAEKAKRAARRISEEEQRMAALYMELGKAAERLKRAQSELATVNAELGTL